MRGWVKELYWRKKWTGFNIVISLGNENRLMEIQHNLYRN